MRKILMEGNHHSGPDGFAKEIKHNHSLSNKKISTKPILFFFIEKIVNALSSCVVTLFSISTNIQFYYFEFVFLKNLGAFDWSCSIICFEIKDRNTILFSSDIYYSNFCIVCYGFFFLQLKFLCSKINCLNFSFS